MVNGCLDKVWVVWGAVMGYRVVKPGYYRLVPAGSRSSATRWCGGFGV